MTEFGSNKGMRWIGDPAGVQLTAIASGRRITCFVTRVYLQGRFDHPKTPEACLATAMRNFDEITDQLGSLIAAGRLDSDGSVVL